MSMDEKIKNDLRNEIAELSQSIDALEKEVQRLKTESLAWELTAKTSGGAFRALDEEFDKAMTVVRQVVQEFDAMDEIEPHRGKLPLDAWFDKLREVLATSGRGEPALSVREFKEEGRCHVPGRGTIISVRIPITESLPKDGDLVCIDQLRYRVRGVEYCMLMVDPPKRSEHVGLLVTPEPVHRA